MGSENSKSDNEQIPERNRTKKNVTQRYYTEDEIQRALANQKRMFEAKQLETQRSSSIYPNLHSQNLHTINSPSTSNAIHYSVTPSAPPENDMPYPRRTTATGEGYQQTNDVLMPRFLQGTAKPACASPSRITPASAGPSRVTPASAGPSRVTPASTGPSRVTPASTGPSRVTPSSAGSLIPSPPSAGPSQTKPARNRNQNRNQGPQSRSKSWNKRGLSQIVNCVTCKGHLSVHIYQCSNGHSSCEGCKLTGARCGQCTSPITNMRNITLESTLADVTITEEQRVKCSKADDGCRLHFKRSELLDHLKECPFNIIPCPIVELSEDCNWKGTIKQLATHFNEAHPNNCGGDVNKEMHILLLQLDYKVMYLVNIGCHQFLVHIQLNTSLNNICMVTQLLGTSFSASKWTYEWHVYNKREPRRKFEYVDVCKSNATPLSDIINTNNCATINIDHAKTFLDSGKLTFKFYIKKQFDRNDNDTTSN